METNQRPTNSFFGTFRTTGAIVETREASSNHLMGTLSFTRLNLVSRCKRRDRSIASFLSISEYLIRASNEFREKEKDQRNREPRRALHLLFLFFFVWLFKENKNATKDG